MKIQEMQDAVHEWTKRKGWRGDGAPSRTFGEDIALLRSEVSEALEAYRDFGMGDVYRQADGQFVEDFITPLPGKDNGYLVNKPEGVGSELADVLIRLLDCCAEYGIDLEEKFLEKMDYNETRKHRHGGKNL